MTLALWLSGGTSSSSINGVYDFAPGVEEFLFTCSSGPGQICSEQKDTPTMANQLSAAIYIADICQELAEVARNAQLYRLVRMLDSATLEARRYAADAGASDERASTLPRHLPAHLRASLETDGQNH